MTIDQYRYDNKAYLGSFTMVFSRSECGVKVGGVDHRPLVAEFETPNPPAYPADPAAVAPMVSAAPLPNVDGTLPVPFGRVTIRGARADATTSELPPTTTVMSPTEHTTASENTTSAPPNPDDADESSSNTSTGRAASSSSAAVTSMKTSTMLPTTSAISTSATAPTIVSTPPAVPTPTSTSAAPEIVFPDEPGTLARTARLENVETITASGEELVVVVKGDELPTDARHGARALETWLGGGNPGTTWATFASTDPDEDGWRWAAINQKTGTVVYIR